MVLFIHIPLPDLDPGLLFMTGKPSIPHAISDELLNMGMYPVLIE